MKLREFRESRGPIQQAAAELDLTPGYLSHLERGLKWPGPFIIRKIGEWSNGAVTAQDIFDNLDMSLFAAKPIRVKKGRGARGSTPHGDPHGKSKVAKKAGRKKEGR